MVQRAVLHHISQALGRPVVAFEAAITVVYALQYTNSSSSPSSRRYAPWNASNCHLNPLVASNIHYVVSPCCGRPGNDKSSDWWLAFENFSPPMLTCTSSDVARPLSLYLQKLIFLQLFRHYHHISRNMFMARQILHKISMVI